MCIIFVAHQVHPKYPLIIASNRDEYLDRPTESMRIWSVDDFSDSDLVGGTSSRNSSDIGSNHHAQPSNHNNDHHHRRVSLAGRDLVRGGTWLGIALPNEIESDDDVDDENDDTYSPSLRWIAITNFREVEEKHGRPSRGGLLMEYLDGVYPSANAFVSGLLSRGQQYNGFNLLVGDKTGIYYYGNRMKEDDQQAATKPLTKGRIYGLSNGLLSTTWQKVERGKEMMQLLCEKDANEKQCLESFHEQLMNMLSDQTQANDDQLPNTGLDVTSERYLSSIFLSKGMLHGKEYGTRSSTTIIINVEGKVSVLERTYHPKQKDQWFKFDSKAGSVDTLDGILISNTHDNT